MVIANMPARIGQIIQVEAMVETREISVGLALYIFHPMMAPTIACDVEVKM